MHLSLMIMHFALHVMMTHFALKRWVCRCVSYWTARTDGFLFLFQKRRFPVEKQRVSCENEKYIVEQRWCRYTRTAPTGSLTAWQRLGKPLRVLSPLHRCIAAARGALGQVQLRWQRAIQEGGRHNVIDGVMKDAASPLGLWLAATIDNRNVSVLCI